MQQSTTQKAPQTKRANRCHVANHVEVWDRVLPSMQAMHAMYAEQDWSVDTVRRMLDEGDALLVVDDDDDDAFAIVRVDLHPYDTDQTELYVYLVWHRGGDAIRRFQNHFETMARAAGARYVRFQSRRRGMFRLALKVGFLPRTVEFVKEL